MGLAKIASCSHRQAVPPYTLIAGKDDTALAMKNAN
jgi:hypothetical protein